MKKENTKKPLANLKKSYRKLSVVQKMILFIGLMFKKDKIVLKDGRLILVHKFLFISNKEYADLGRIRDIQAVYNPAADSYYLAIITDDNMLAFGRGVPTEALQWIRDFVIYAMTR